MTGGTFQGWYFKHQQGPRTLAVIVGRASEEAFLQVITPQGAHRVKYPLGDYRMGKGTLRLGENLFTSRGIRLRVHRPGLELEGLLRYGSLTPIRGDIMGPFRFLPMECRHSVVSMDHRVAGQVRLNGTILDFSRGRGYLEGDAGRSFPRAYTWVQCNDFPRCCSVMASAAQIPFMGGWFWGCIGVVWLEGREYRLATYRGARILRRGAAQLVLAQGSLTLEVSFLQPHGGHLLDAPARGRMDRTIREAPSAPASFTLYRGGRVLFQGESPFASYEQVDSPTD